MMDFIATHNLTGAVIGVITFFIIGVFHPLVIKGEYYFGVKCWWAFALAGVLTGWAAISVSDVMWQAVLGVTSCSCFWSIHEVFQQRERVRKGWFPKRGKR